MVEIDGVSYGAFIIPGLVMLALLTESISNASFGIYFPKYNGTIYEILSAPISMREILLGYVGAATTKSVIVGSINYCKSICGLPRRSSVLDGGLFSAYRSDL